MKIKMRLLLVCVSVLILSSSEAQPIIRGTIKSGPAANQIELWLKPSFNNTTQFLYQIGFPVAFPASATPPPSSIQVTQAPEFIAAFGSQYAVAVNDVAQNTAGTEKYFNIILTRGSGSGGSLPQPWTADVEVKVLTVTFVGSDAKAHVKLADYQDGGSDGQGLFYTVDQGNNYYQDNTGDSRNNFYDVSGVSQVGGDASAGFVETIALITLPVQLVNFSGYKNGGKNTLNWTVAGEVNNRGFDVLRSTDGVNYTSIGFVNSQVGGYANSEQHYTFDDNNLAGKKQYYRLNQKDLDGHSKLSTIVMITRDKPTELAIGTLFPNPARNEVNVIINAPDRSKVSLVITDMMGKTVIQQQANVDMGSNTIPINVGKLAAGSYLVKLVCQSSDCEMAASKFNKL